MYPVSLIWACTVGKLFTEEVKKTFTHIVHFYDHNSINARNQLKNTCHKYANVGFPVTPFNTSIVGDNGSNTSSASPYKGPEFEPLESRKNIWDLLTDLARVLVE